MGKQNKNQATTSMTPTHSRVAFLYAASELLAKLAAKTTTPTETTLTYKQRKAMSRRKKYENAKWMKRIRKNTENVTKETDDNTKSQSLNKLSRYLADTMTQVCCFG
jgi:hypothetical protein